MILSEKQCYSLDKERISNCQPQQSKIIQQLIHFVNYQSTDSPDVLQLLAWKICDAIDSVQFSIILLWDSQSGHLEVSATAGINTNQFPLQKLIDSHIASLNQVFAIGVSQFFPRKAAVEDIGKPTEVFFRQTYSQQVLAPSMYAVVIESAQTGKMGVLVVGNWDNPYAFDVMQQNLVNLVGQITAITISNTRTIQALEEREQQLARQNEILLEQNREIEKNRQHIQLQQLQLLEARQTTSQFLTTTSHELRTPLNVILGLSQVLLRQRTSALCERQVEIVERILSNGNQLLATINDLLYFNKIENDYGLLELEEFNLTTLILKTISEHAFLAERKHLHLSFHINLNTHLIVNDSKRLKQVLDKLLLNAIKFTETGSVEVKVEEISNDRIAITVIDTGIGIAESELENIFEQFRQVDQSTTRKYGGTGLGLAITKSLVESMQGTISVTSNLGQGSNFQIELPRFVK